MSESETPIDAIRARQDIRERLGGRRNPDVDALLRQLAEVEQERDAATKKLADEERAHEQTIGERDAFHDAADKLAYAIAPMDVIGEHSNMNDPWTNALDELEMLRDRAEAWAVLNKARELDEATVARVKTENASLAAELQAVKAKQGWRPMNTAPETAELVIGKMRDGQVYWMHYASDLSGSEQPAFQGWFRDVGKSYVQCDPIAWMPDPPLPSPPSLPAQEAPRKT